MFMLIMLVVQTSALTPAQASTLMLAHICANIKVSNANIKVSNANIKVSNAGNKAAQTGSASAQAVGKSAPAEVKNAGSSEDSIFRLAEAHYAAGEYYNAVTETFRYQYLYPRGKHHPDSLILQGKAYWRGGNSMAAMDSMTRCFEAHRDEPAGEEALLYSGHMRLLAGSPYYAHRTYLTYDYIYRKGRLAEEVHYEKCLSLALMGELHDAKEEIASYGRTWGEHRYYSRLKELEKLIDNENSREKKSVWLSVAGSAVLPGFGHFYTGRYEVGILTLATNAALMFLAWDGYRDGNMFRMILFGVAELSFYQHSLFSAAGNVYAYNSRDDFNRKVMMGISGRF
jgi:outer membrane protein assembly factor BamD (BamD/ComL family)